MRVLGRSRLFTPMHHISLELDGSPEGVHGKGNCQEGASASVSRFWNCSSGQAEDH
jgi:hypothetical protein